MTFLAVVGGLAILSGCIVTGAIGTSMLIDWWRKRPRRREIKQLERTLNDGR